MTKEENDRQYRVVNQLITMHAYIAQTKKSQAFWLSIGLLFTSAITCGFTFADDATIRMIGISAGSERLVMGLSSLILFGLSIVELKVDWSSVARAHEDASKRLALLKADYRRADASEVADKHPLWLALSTSYESTLSSIPDIPEKLFSKLKARHLYKVELSRAIDKNPRVPVLVLALSMRWRATSAFLKSSKNEKNEPPSK